MKNTAFFKGKYYNASISGDGSIDITNPDTGIPILNSSPKFLGNYGDESPSIDLSFNNPGMETDTDADNFPDGWGWFILPSGVNDTFTITRSSDTSSGWPSQGNYALKCDHTTPGTGNIYITSPIVNNKVGKIYECSIDSLVTYYKSGTITFYCQYYNNDSGTGTSYGINQVEIQHVNLETPQTTHIELDLPYTAKSFRLVVELWNNPAATFYLDNLTIKETEPVYETNQNSTPVISDNGDTVTVTATDETNEDVTLNHTYILNKTTSVLVYKLSLTYKSNVTVTEERIDFTIPTTSANIMTRDLNLVKFDTAKDYYSDFYTPKIVKFTNGISFIGMDDMSSMRLKSLDKINSTLSFYLDCYYDHLFGYYVKNGNNARGYLSKQQYSIGESKNATVSFNIDVNNIPVTLIKTRQPYGYDATIIFTNHPDQETVDTINAVMYGTADTSDPEYGKRGLAAHAIGLTKGVFVSGQNGADLQNEEYRDLIDKLYNDGVEIVGHSITPTTDSRSTVDSGLLLLTTTYGSCGWIDHGPSPGVGNWEDLSSQGTFKNDPNYSLDLFDEYGIIYNWVADDFESSPSSGLNLLTPSSTGQNTSFFYYNRNVDYDVTDAKQIYNWRALGSFFETDLYYTQTNIDRLINERGVNITHEYLGYSYDINHSYYLNGSTYEIFPAFETELAYMEKMKDAGKLWTPTLRTAADYWLKLKYITITPDFNGSYFVTNNGASSIQGLTLLYENDIESALVDGNPAKEIQGSKIILPDLSAGQTISLVLSSKPVQTQTGFFISDLSVTPNSVSTGQSVTITAKVSNTGGTSGVCDVILKINGIVETTKSISLDAKTSSTITFNTTINSPGENRIDVNGATDSLTVNQVQSSTTQSQPTPEKKETNWLISGIIISIVVILAVVVIVVLRRVHS